MFKKYLCQVTRHFSVAETANIKVPSVFLLCLSLWVFILMVAKWLLQLQALHFRQKERKGAKGGKGQAYWVLHLSKSF